MNAIEKKKELLSDYNREQLDQGIRRDGQALPPYSPKTVRIKKEKGQQTNPMNLRDTGSFQDHITPKRFKDFFEMQSNDPKEQMLAERYGEEIIGVTDENLARFRAACKPLIFTGVKRIFKK